MSKKCKYLKQKINKEVWCTYHNKKYSGELCFNCEYKEYNVPKDKTNLCRNSAYSLQKKTKSRRKHKLTKATDIPKSIKLKVWERDNHRCVFCHTFVEWNYANSHYIKRSHLGLGITEQNIMTNCSKCHEDFEKSPKREIMKEKAKRYFKSVYPDWNEENLVYKKYK